MGRPLGTFKKISEGDFKTIVSRYGYGEPLYKIAKDYNISTQSLDICFKRRKIKRRTNNWKGNKNPKYNNGGCYINKQGYEICYKKGKKIKKHRVIMEEKLGRKLSKDETIHHKDGNPSNNNIENLEITSTSQHSKHHVKERWNNTEWKQAVVESWRNGGNKGLFKKS